MAKRPRRTVIGIAVLLGLASVLLASSSLFSSGPAAGEPLTWSKQIAPLFQQHCQGCHRPGDIAPFPLVSYSDAYRERRKVLRAVERRKMDFHWQGTYTFSKPMPLPGGTRIDVAAVYDNSEANRKNPTKPPRDVAWGEGTADEMCIAFIRVTADAERLGYRPSP